MNSKIMDQAYNYFLDMDYMGLDGTFIELRTDKGDKKYNGITTRISESMFYDYDKFIFEDLSLYEIYHYLNNIFDGVFIDKYSSLIKKCNKKITYLKKERLDTEVIFTDNFKTIDKIVVSSITHPFIVPMLAHEYTHVITRRKEEIRYGEILCNVHYEELPSIIMEKITAVELGYRISNRQLSDYMDGFRMSKNKKMIVNLDNASKEKSSTKEFNDYYNYLKHLFFGYIISDIYASRFMDFYKDNRKDSLEKYRDLILGKIDMITFLNYFEIGIKDIKTSSSYVKKIDRIRV